jgi:hypothetical protein
MMNNIRHGCGRIYPKGSRMSFIVAVDGGDIMQSYWCETCDDFWRILEGDEIPQDGIFVGDLLEYDNHPFNLEKTSKER